LASVTASVSRQRAGVEVAFEPGDGDVVGADQAQRVVIAERAGVDAGGAGAARGDADVAGVGQRDVSVPLTAPASRLPASVVTVKLSEPIQAQQDVVGQRGGVDGDGILGGAAGAVAG